MHRNLRKRIQDKHKNDILWSATDFNEISCIWFVSTGKHKYICCVHFHANDMTGLCILEW